jgi:hypothetical protein
MAITFRSGWNLLNADPGIPDQRVLDAEIDIVIKPMQASLPGTEISCEQVDRSEQCMHAVACPERLQVGVGHGVSVLGRS